jgi:ubiquinone/menaquinone biosynthesis C-methylase UbiE
MTAQEVERWSSFRVWLYSLFNHSTQTNEAVVDYASLTADDHFLDVGCGLGEALEHAVATGAQVAGVDPSPAMVRRATRRVPDARVDVGSAESIPFPDDHFTVVVSVSSYHHWADPEAGLKEIIRVLSAAGRVHIVEAAKEKGHGLDEESAEELAQTLLDVGYATSSVDSLPVGRRRFVVVSAMAPPR